MSLSSDDFQLWGKWEQQGLDITDHSEAMAVEDI